VSEYEPNRKINWLITKTTKIMKNNKLIAEFMGLETPFNEISDATLYTYKGIEEASAITFVVDVELHEMRYHLSWDWLMPVVEKIKILVMEDDSDELYNSEEWDNITHTLVQIEIKSVYQAVVEFIKNQNN
jgi:hypothetical protein|tara:strand:- start:111 stop:503 length:393 start_codon:yes stop_codon:yes gene_type:complete